MLFKNVKTVLYWLSISMFKVTRPSYFVRVPSYFETFGYPHLYFDRKSNIYHG